METKHTLSSLKRPEELVRFLEQRNRATVIEIAKHLGVSEATVRRDLETLAELGKLKRFHGGAKAVPQTPPESPVMRRTIDQEWEKKRIAQAAAEMINDGETIFLGSGTTVLQVAHHLHHHRDLTIITNSLLVINALVDAPDITMVALGGILLHSEMSMIGHITEQALAQVHAHKIIMSIRALDVDHGLTNDYLPEMMTDRAILALGGEVIIVADHTKFGRVSTAFLAPVTVVRTLVTDVAVSSELVSLLMAKGVRVVAV